MARISIIGSGWVGTIVGKGFKELDNDVIFVDINEEKVNQLKKEGYEATTDTDFAVKNTDISFISVPTPTSSGKIDLKYIKSASESIGKSLKDKHSYHVVVIKSTVIPKTTEEVVKPILEEISGKKCGEDFGLCMVPEFLTQIHSSWSKDSKNKRDFFSEDRIVIGGFDKRSGDTIEELFKPLRVPIFRTDLMTAELIKYASNCCLASRISYWNEVFYICNQIGIDSDLVAKIAALDKRIGKYGTIHGKGFGGTCFPKDLQAFISFSEKVGHNPIFLKAVRDINEKIKKDRGVRE